MHAYPCTGAVLAERLTQPQRKMTSQDKFVVFLSSNHLPFPFEEEGRSMLRPRRAVGLPGG